MALTSIRRWQIEPLKWILKKITGIVTQNVDITVNEMTYPTVELEDSVSVEFIVTEVSSSETKISANVLGSIDQVQTDWEQSDSGAIDFIKNKPTIPEVVAQVQSDWEQSDSGSVDFILNKPTIPAAQIQSDWEQSDTGAVDFIKNKPTVFGEPGEPGADGASAFVYIAYASDASGTGFTLTFSEALNYIAILSTDTEIVSPVVGDFAGLWKNYKGADGEPGIDGADGLDNVDIFDIYIDFLELTEFVYNCPYAMVVNSQISEGTDATLDPVATTNMAQFEKLTVTPTQIGLIILKGELL